MVWWIRCPQVKRIRVVTVGDGEPAGLAIPGPKTFHDAHAAIHLPKYTFASQSLIVACDVTTPAHESWNASVDRGTFIQILSLQCPERESFLLFSER